jgi:type IV secretion system protein VirD4
VIPNLLDYPGACVVLDIKGENYAVTSRYRRDVLGHDVYLLDPFGVTGARSPRHQLAGSPRPGQPRTLWANPLR